MDSKFLTIPYKIRFLYRKEKFVSIVSRNNIMVQIFYFQFINLNSNRPSLM